VLPVSTSSTGVGKKAWSPDSASSSSTTKLELELAAGVRNNRSRNPPPPERSLAAFAPPIDCVSCKVALEGVDTERSVPAILDTGVCVE
jgi:hypothetical protein